MRPKQFSTPHSTPYFPRYSQKMRIHPPRPESAIPPSTLSHYKGYIAQYKYNDVRTLAIFSPFDEVELLNRHLQPHRFYSLSPGMKKALLSLKLRKDRYHILDGGILHRVGGLRDRIVFWDILVHDGRYLIGETLARRYALLQKICENPAQSEEETGFGIGLRVNEHIWLAPLIRENFERHFRLSLGLDVLEGLVLKIPGSRLEQAFGERNNGSWQIRVRKPHVNYAF